MIWAITVTCLRTLITTKSHGVSRVRPFSRLDTENYNPIGDGSRRSNGRRRSALRVFAAPRRRALRLSTLSMHHTMREREGTRHARAYPKTVRSSSLQPYPHGLGVEVDGVGIARVWVLDGHRARRVIQRHAPGFEHRGDPRGRVDGGQDVSL